MEINRKHLATTNKTAHTHSYHVSTTEVTNDKGKCNERFHPT